MEPENQLEKEMNRTWKSSFFGVPVLQLWGCGLVLLYCSLVPCKKRTAWQFCDRDLFGFLGW